VYYPPLIESATLCCGNGVAYGLCFSEILYSTSELTIPQEVFGIRPLHLLPYTVDAAVRDHATRTIQTVSRTGGKFSLELEGMNPWIKLYYRVRPTLYPYLL
jgi:hypothetical protein